MLLSFTSTPAAKPKKEKKKKDKKGGKKAAAFDSDDDEPKLELPLAVDEEEDEEEEEAPMNQTKQKGGKKKKGGAPAGGSVFALLNGDGSDSEPGEEDDDEDEEAEEDAPAARKVGSAGGTGVKQPQQRGTWVQDASASRAQRSARLCPPAPLSDGMCPRPIYGHGQPARGATHVHEAAGPPCCPQPVMCIAEILSVAPHPKADRLRVCQVGAAPESTQQAERLACCNCSLKWLGLCGSKAHTGSAVLQASAGGCPNIMPQPPKFAWESSVPCHPMPCCSRACRWMPAVLPPSRWSAMPRMSRRA